MIREGQYIQHPDIAHGVCVRVVRSLHGQLMYELPSGKTASIAEHSPRGRELAVYDEPQELPTMPIQGLTTNNEGKLPYIGVLRKGGEKQKKVGQGGKEYTVFGKDLNHFRFTSDDPAVQSRFNAIFGEEPAEVTVQLPFCTAEENFDAWKESWAAGGLVHRCDGVTMVRWQAPDGSFSDEPKPCDSHTKQERDRCKEVGRLKVIIRELGRMALVTVLTHSKHDIVNIHGALKVLEKQCGSLTGIPFVLKRKEVGISALEGGKRVTRKKWLIHIEPAPAWAERLIEAQATAALPSAERLQLNAAPDYAEAPEIDDWDDDDVIEAQVEAQVMMTPEQLAEINAKCEAIGKQSAQAAQYFLKKDIANLTTSEAQTLLTELEQYTQKANSAAPPAGNPLAQSVSELATPKQIAMARAICRDLNIDLDTELQETLKVDAKIEELSRKAASAFIDHLKTLQDAA